MNYLIAGDVAAAAAATVVFVDVIAVAGLLSSW